MFATSFQSSAFSAPEETMSVSSSPGSSVSSAPVYPVARLFAVRTYLPSGTAVSDASASTSSTIRDSVPPMVSAPSATEQTTSTPASLVPVVWRALKLWS